jgi:predicted signal transduction protein with EAL and GGDEF domain
LIGVAQLEARRENSFEFVERADTALYEAKRHGKNVVVIHGMGAVSPKVLLPPPMEKTDKAKPNQEQVSKR